jgi:ATP-dependent Clp protease protease subunit
MNNLHNPHVIEVTGRSSKAYDLPTKLLQDRIIYIGQEITPDSANSVIMQLLWLNADNPEKDINIYINSPGGSVYDGLAIKDVIDNIDCKVNTVGTGMCASMGAYLLAAGSGTRRATKNCRIMIHSVSNGTQGTFHDMKVDFKETEYLQNKMLRGLTKFSEGKIKFDELKEMTARDRYLSPEECIEFGLVDSVV